MYWSDCFTVSHTSVHPPANAAQTDGETVHMLIDFFFLYLGFRQWNFSTRIIVFRLFGTFEVGTKW